MEGNRISPIVLILGVLVILGGLAGLFIWWGNSGQKAQTPNPENQNTPTTSLYGKVSQVTADSFVVNEGTASVTVGISATTEFKGIGAVSELKDGEVVLIEAESAVEPGQKVIARFVSVQRILETAGAKTALPAEIYTLTGVIQAKNGATFEIESPELGLRSVSVVESTRLFGQQLEDFQKGATVVVQTQENVNKSDSLTAVSIIVVN